MVLTRRPAGSQPSADSGDEASPVLVNPSSSKANGSKSGKKEDTPLWVKILLVVIAVISVTTIPHPFHPEGEPSLQHVFYYGWLTALSTGLGVAPFVFLPDVPTFWVGISNGKNNLSLLFRLSSGCFLYTKLIFMY